VKTLSVRQPWAHAIVNRPHDPKTIENRSWKTRHRGSLAIHAARSTGSFGPRADLLLPDLVAARDGLAFGAIIGIVQLVDDVPHGDVAGNKWAAGPRCWILREPRPIAPIPWRGSQLLFEVPDELIARALAEASRDATPACRFCGRVTDAPGFCSPACESSFWDGVV
jgi:hypothetical protein